MTVDPLFLQSTSTIATACRFYPAEIEVPHHQLRNFISTVYEDKIFYVNKYDIYILNLQTRERSLLVTVPFEARCLTAAHGWVCVGGETKGDCAFMHIGEDEGQPGTFCDELQVEMLGNEIVNSMTIQVLKPELQEQHKGEVVVLISNNDHTVTIYSLTRKTVLATVEHPQSMNYALLSPNSTIMAAVGDENKVYFMRRILEDETAGSPSTMMQYPSYDWRPLSAPDIPRGTLQAEDFSFAVAFSPDGRLCAVSSQGGAITVFDMDAIEEEVDPPEDAILCTFRSSRPSLWGCVRSMAFSPAHWDVLAWAEDHGRIGVADVRQGFHRRQCIHLKQDDCDQVEITDATPEEWKGLDVKERLRRQHQQRMQALRGHPPVGARSLPPGPRASTSPEPSELDRRPSLTSREQAIIQTLETTINDIDSVQRPYSINYTATQPRLHPSASGPHPRREYDVQLLNPSPRSATSHTPRRRSSVVLSPNQSSQYLVPDESTRLTMTASPGPISDDGLPPPMSTNDLTPAAGSASSHPLPYNIPPADPWHVIEASLANRRAQDAPNPRPPPGLSQIEYAITAERQLASRLERQLDDESRLSALLRSVLDVRERLLEARQREFGSRPSGERDLSPSLERLLHRQLRSERDHGQRRAEELEVEIRNMSRRVSQLMDERDVLVQRYRSAHRLMPTSASTSAPPTASAPIDNRELERRLQHMDEDRRLRAQRISDLEQEVRRAETRIEHSSLHSNMEMTRASLRRSWDETSPLESRILPILSANLNPHSSDARRLLESFENIPSLSPTARRLRPRTPTELAGNGTRATLPRISELATRVTDNDLRVARMMMMRYNGADTNGNWSPAAAYRAATGLAQLGTTGGGSSLDEIIRDSGVGTAGIGWSPDGLKLFAGSEQGIFEFGLNIEDRLQCPTLEMR